MSRLSKILLTIVVILAVLALAAWGGIKWWTRSGRMDQLGCRELVERAWVASQDGMPAGSRWLAYDVDGYRVVLPSKFPLAPRFEEIADIVRQRFPQREPDEEFFGRVSLTHEGRIWVARRWCERVRISPTQYEGQSIELWIDPPSAFPLGWRKIDLDGDFIRGYRYVGKGDSDSDGMAGDRWGSAFREMAGSMIAPDAEDLSPEQIKEKVELGALSAPQWLPSGFELIGGRAFARPDPIERRPGMGQGRPYGERPEIEGQGPIGPGRVHLFFSDGLNTISLVQFPAYMGYELGPDPERIQRTFDFKAGEIRRLFHTSFTARTFPGAVVLLYGEVAEDVLRQVADSLTEVAPQAPPGVRPGLGPGPGRPGRFGPSNRPPFGVPPGRRERDPD